MKCRWQEGNRITLLENGDQYYPALFVAISRASRWVILESFIWLEGEVGWRLHAVLLKAVRCGIQMGVLFDGYDSPDFNDESVGELTTVGVIFRYYDPRPKLMGMRTNLFRWMRHKIVATDGTTTFVGGISYSTEHVSDYGPEAKQGYAVQVEGSMVPDILQFELEDLPNSETVRRWQRRRRHQPEINQVPGETQALLIWRDNQDHRDNIERHYLKMLTNARREVIIANAYFFPGYRLSHAMRNATRHGVRAKLIVQGGPNTPIVKFGAHLLYYYLVKGGVQICEHYCHPLHGKVALADDYWATVGSSSLDPLSLSLNLEANLITHDRVFNQTLCGNLNGLIARDCQRIDRMVLPKRNWWRLGVSVMAFHFLCRFPARASWLSARTPRLARVSLPVQPEIETQDRVDSQTRDNSLRANHIPTGGWRKEYLSRSPLSR